MGRIDGSAYVPPLSYKPAPAPLVLLGRAAREGGSSCAAYRAVHASFTPPLPDAKETAEQILRAGDRTARKDDYEQRMQSFAQHLELGAHDERWRTRVVGEILRQDSNAFDSWLTAGRVNTLAEQGRISAAQRDLIADSFAASIEQGDLAAAKVPAKFVRESHDPELIAAYIDQQDLNSKDSFANALEAFSGLEPRDMGQFVTDPGNQSMLREFYGAVQQHQDWYESLTVDLNIPLAFDVDADIGFSKEQLTAMRTAFLADDGLITNGELLLAYPDRQERNEAVTRQYLDLSNQMAGIVGDDNANWASFAVWASDEIGRNLDDTGNKALEQQGITDGLFWLSKGNSKLVADIGPAFNHFTDTFANGKNRDMTFEQFWSSFEQKYAGRGISYLDGADRNSLDMKNAFKAYYETMQLNDREQGAMPPDQREELSQRRAQLVLYANTLVGLQEQKLVQQDIEQGLQILGVITNPGGAASRFVDLHVPGAGGQAVTLNTDQDLPATPWRITDLDAEFVTADGKTINLGATLAARLNGLDPNNEDETDLSNSGTDHWENYGARMGYIYHLFAGYQKDERLFNDPRALGGSFASRAEALNNDPELLMPSRGFG